MSDSVRPHRWQPTRLCRPWNSPGKNTGVGCHFLLHCVKVKVLSRDWLIATPWNAAHQAPPSMGFSRQESLVYSQVSCQRMQNHTDCVILKWKRGTTLCFLVISSAGLLTTLFTEEDFKKWLTGPVFGMGMCFLYDTYYNILSWCLLSGNVGLVYLHGSQGHDYLVNFFVFIIIKI